MTPDGNQPRIHILDPATVNQIAAGEVVERPASVVKELTENAIDAGATTIRIDLKMDREGITAISVTDDGCGMSPEDALLAFTPHATSKISGIGDLHRIGTLGFRGEALASIAAVAEVTLTTRPKGSGAVPGTRIVVKGGEILSNSGSGAPEGTRITVEDLFYNTPARKKFQKSKNTELAQIHTILEGICLSHPEIAFRLFANDAELLVTDRTDNLPDTIARLYGSEVVRDLVPVTCTLDYMTIGGYISRPSLSRKDTARVLVSINQRFVTSRSIANAIKAGYGTLLPKDRFPVSFLTLRIDTALVDINVHPTKKIVRISREQEITDAIRDAVKTALLSHDLVPSAGTPDRIPELIEEQSIPAIRPEPRYDHAGTAPAGVSESTHTGTTMTDRQLRQTELPCGVALVEPVLPALEVIGQFGGIYILATTPAGELMIIDQHAAHERILYEQVTSRSESARRSQELLIPAILHRTPRETAILKTLLPQLAGEGFTIEEFGHDTFLVRAIPVVMGKPEDTTMLDEIISDLTNPDSARSVDNRERIARVIACRGAIKAGTVCTPEQCQRILNQLRLTRNPYTCPHGRPTIIRFTRPDLDAMFHRT